MGNNPPRTIKHQLEIRAPLDAVWSALTSADRIARWYALDARVQPGEGGRIWLGWPGLYEQQVIEIWQEGRQLRTRDHARRIAIDWILEGRAGATLLCFELSADPEVSTVCSACDGVHADEFDVLARGWTLHLFNLKHMLEHHPYGLARQIVLPLAVSGGTPDELWARLLGAGGLGFDRPGTGRYRARALTGELLDGEIDLWAPPRALALTVRGINDARLTVDIRGCASEWTVWVCFLTYGVDRPVLRAIENRWKPALQTLLRARVSTGRRERLIANGGVEADL
jgi:uncharacterized protein YndB with AHSA1/START domain